MSALQSRPAPNTGVISELALARAQRNTVLIIDDLFSSRLLLAEIVRQIDPKLNLELFDTPSRALEYARQNRVDMVLTDFKLPEFDGIELVKQIRGLGHCVDIPIIVITVVDDRQIRYTALEAGATDFLIKPLDEHETRARCANLLELRRHKIVLSDQARVLQYQVDRSVSEIHERELETLSKLAKAGEFRDKTTGNHLMRMARYSALIGQNLGLGGNFDYVIFGYKLTQQAILNSLLLALVGATVGVMLALLQAYYLNRGDARRRGLVDALLSLPLGIPGIILGLGFLIIAIRTPLYSTLTIILVAYIARFFPFATRTVSGMLLAINPELEQSARASGASWLQCMRFVLLPLLLPAIIAAWLMLFVIFIRELGATILLYAQGTETISVALVLLSEHSSASMAALAVIQIILLLGAFLLFRLTRVSLVQS